MKILTTAILFIFLVATAQAQELKVLAIGNSFSTDGVEYFDELANAAGRKLVIGNVYFGGCSLEQHVTHAKEDIPVYLYTKIDGTTKTETDSSTMLHCILDEEWDYITFQQASHFSGKSDSYFPYLQQLIEYVKGNVRNSNVEFAIHQTWAYDRNSTHSGFANYAKNQSVMYDSIVVAYNKAAARVGITKMIPSGTAIQNGRAVLGDVFCRDGYHLSLDLGRYTASCVWFETFFGDSVIGNKFAPNGLSDKEKEVAQTAAHDAIILYKK